MFVKNTISTTTTDAQLDNSYFCNTCERVFQTLDSLKIHRQVHVKQSTYVCNFCYQSFRSIHQLNVHNQQHIVEKRFDCLICQNRSTSASSLDSHQCRRDAQKLFHCIECEKCFTIQYELKKHMIKHTNQKTYSCPICVKTFSRQGSLHVHQRLHTDPEPRYECDLCDKRFHWNSNLKSHRRSHFRKRFQCRICRKSFSNQFLLDAHGQHHLHEKWYECVWCKKIYLNRYKLNYHMKNVHANFASFQCKQCKETFKTSIQLRSHHFTHIGEKPFRCRDCDKSFLTQHNLKLHENTHGGFQSFQCDLCDGNFRYKRNLYVHMRRHQSGRSDADYKAKRTAKRNTFDLKRYSCKICGRTFAYQKSVTKCNHRLARRKQKINVELIESDDNAINELKIKIDILPENRNEPGIPLWELNLSSLPVSVANPILAPGEEILVSTISYPNSTENEEPSTNIATICENNCVSYVDEPYCEALDFSTRVSSSIRLLQTPSYNDFTNIDSLISCEQPLDYSFCSPSTPTTFERTYRQL